MARWTRRSVLKTVGAAGLVGCRPRGDTPGTVAGSPTGDTGPTTTGRPPNVVYVYSDQHRGPILGAFGHPTVRTPNLDGLAAASVSYPNMFTNSPLCRPARATMMTGRLPHTHGCWNNDQLADRDGPSHARRILDEAGYLTAMIGKAHLTEPKGHPMDPDNVAALQAWGFAYTFELLSQITCATKPNAYSDWLAENTPSGERSKAERYADYVTKWELLGFPAPDQPPYGLTTADHVDLWCGDLAAAWIRAYDDPRPFYLQVNFPGPHSPYDATTEFRSLYDAAAAGFPTSILGPPVEPVSPVVQWLWDMRPELHGLTADQSRDLLLTYFAKVTLIDRAVGTVLAALDDAGLSDDTWVIYGSDHGDMLGDHELWGKVAMYDGAVRTPLLVRPPGGTTPWTCDGAIDQLDVTASILALCGLAPDGAGSSRVGQWLGGPDAPDAQAGKDAVIAEVAAQPDGHLRTGMLRETRYKLVYDFDADRPVELYDLDADPDEVTNRILDPGLAPTVRAMQDRLLDAIAADHD
ncbi:MAG: sulfatase-like hydrolase/transferase [Myxococcota bacterium]